MKVSYRAWIVPSLERGVPRDSSNGGQIHPGVDLKWLLK